MESPAVYETAGDCLRIFQISPKIHSPYHLKELIKLLDLQVRGFPLNHPASKQDDFDLRRGGGERNKVRRERVTKHSEGIFAGTDCRKHHENKMCDLTNEVNSNKKCKSAERFGKILLNICNRTHDHKHYTNGSDSKIGSKFSKTKHRAIEFLKKINLQKEFLHQIHNYISQR